jgi:hypothetical protein
MQDSPFSEGYFAGLVNEAVNPHFFLSPNFLPWSIGNLVGLDVHCATVEAVYLSEK